MKCPMRFGVDDGECIGDECAWVIKHQDSIGKYINCALPSIVENTFRDGGYNDDFAGTNYQPFEWEWRVTKND